MLCYDFNESDIVHMILSIRFLLNDDYLATEIFILLLLLFVKNCTICTTRL